MTLRSRLATGLLSIALILVIPLLVAVQSLNRLHRDALGLQTGEFAASLLLGRLRESLFDLRREETRLLFVHDSAASNDIALQITRTDQLADSLEQYQLTNAATRVRRAVSEITKWGPVEYQAALSGKGSRADTISTTYIVPALDSADAGIRAAGRDLAARTTDRVFKSATSIGTTRVVTLVAMVVALIVAGLVALYLTQSITRPVRALERGMEAVADGQLEYKLAYDSAQQDEFGHLARSFDEMTRQLRELDKLKAEFVSVASHELKTPINVIIGYLQLLEDGIYGPLNQKQIEIHQTLNSQVQQLHRLVKHLLDVTRFEAGGGRLEVRPIPIGTMLAELEHAFQVLAMQRGVTFAVERRNELPSEVVWDGDRINEVLGNLLSNAFKFTPKGGSVRLIVESNGSSVAMKVRDTGAGIPADQLPRIFDKFYQADNQGAASTAGSGLGLAIAKQIVEAHGGTITCESSPGIGTTFSIELPAVVSRRSASGRPMRALT